MRELGEEESNNDYTLLENFVLFNELSGWLFNFIEEMEKSDPKNVYPPLLQSDDNKKANRKKLDWMGIVNTAILWFIV